LLFAVNVYEQVVEAYIAGLEDLIRSGGALSKIGSVASIFVSRIDVATDKRLGKLGDEKLVERLCGKAGIANAKIAYVCYKALFSGPRWQHLAEAGAKTQRLLWASTSVKNPVYKDTMYVDALIGRDTVDTIPPATMDAFRDHGAVIPDAIEQDVSGGRALLAELEENGVSLKTLPMSWSMTVSSSSRTHSTSCSAPSRNAVARCARESASAWRSRRARRR
jgi:transaldolase/glucose-6-phosphate isomerase